MRRLVPYLTALLLLGAVLTPAWAVDARMKWVEVDISPRGNGWADVVYKIRWQVDSGRMHGFYMEGFDRAYPEFSLAGSNALDAQGRRYPLEISEVSGGKYDVILANGRAIGPGEVTYVVVYKTDLSGAGMLDYTDSEFGRLVVFNWAPVQWDEPLEHETVYLHYPIPVDGTEVTQARLDQVGFRTEKFVNERYLISYYGQEYQGKHWLTVRFHRNDLDARYHMQIQAYVIAKFFPNLKDAQSEPLVPGGREPGGDEGWPPTGEPRGTNPVGVAFAFLLGGVLVAVAVLLVRAKYTAYSAAAAEMDGIRWDRTDWIPPKIKVSSFRQEGKIADLHPLEAAFLLDIPVSKILAAVVLELERRGLFKVLSNDPLRVERLYPIGVLPDKLYEDMMWNAVRDEGRLDDAELKAVIEQIAENVQAKCWDCDLEATKEYYRKQIREQFEAVQAGGRLDGMYDSWGHSYYRGYPHYFYGASQGQENAVEKGIDKQLPDRGTPTAAMIRADACHSACYVHTACHDACHDACHSACHSACPSACHSACPSACVSGGAD